MYDTLFEIQLERRKVGAGPFYYMTVSWYFCKSYSATTYTARKELRGIINLNGGTKTVFIM